MYQNWKGKSKIVSICRWHDLMILYIMNLKDNKKLLYVINENLVKLQDKKLTQ